MDALSQAKNLIEKSRNILILPSQESQGDSLGSALALFFTLKKLGKNVNVFTEKIPEKFQFLTKLQTDSPKDFVISIDTSERDISEMRYEKNKKDLKIYLTLNRGAIIGEEDISFSPRPPDEANIELKKENLFTQNPDLLITLGAKSLENLGKVFDQNPRLFYETPILNIDNQPSNENFGQVNLIVITSSSLSEILINLIKLMDAAGPPPGQTIDSVREALLDGNIATYLLTGVIWSSQNFRSPKTQPKTLETSAFLIEKGANHQKIIQHLYKQKNISQIKLLGRILEKLNFDEEKELYAASLTERDFQDCAASSGDLGFAIEELKFNFRYLPNLLILWESHGSASLVKGILYSSKLDLIEKVLENFEGVSRGEGALFLIRDENLNSAKEKVLQILT